MHVTNPGTIRARDIAGAAGLLDALPDAVAATDAEGKVLWANRAFAEIFGPGDPGSRSLETVAGPYAESFEGHSLLDLAKTGSGQLEITAFDHQGMPFPCLVRVVTVDRPQGEPSRLVTLTDQGALQRVRAELVLKAESAMREREILRATCEALDDAALVVDDAERLVLANGAARRLFPIGGPEGMGRSLTEMGLPPSVRGAWFTFLASGRSAATQTARVTVGGETRTLLLRLGRAWSSRGVPLASMLVMRDLTRFTGPDRQKFDFIAQVSHELRTPLAAIQGFIATVLADPDLDAELRTEFCQIVHDESQRLAALVEKLLEVAQLDSGRIVLERRSVDAGTFLSDCAARFADRASAAGAPITVVLPPAPITAFLDTVRVERALDQLIANALRFAATPRGVQIDAASEDERLRISVRDWGPGVPPEDLERIFDPFFRVVANQRPNDASNGLGLALSRQIVERHGGAIRAEIPGDGGLRFVMELPLS